MKQQLMGAWWLILVSIVSGVAGQTAIKLGVSQPGAMKATANLLSLVALIVRSPLILLGLAFYGIGVLAWITVLSRLELSVAYSFLALNFILVAIVSAYGLGETMPLMRWAGILVLCLGILLVARQQSVI